MSDETIPRFPLEWPMGWKRTPYGQRKRAMFGKVRQERSTTNPNYTWQRREALSVGDGLERLTGELRRLGARNYIISSNLRLRNDGLPMASQAKQLEDPGVAVYFKLQGKPLVLACDRWSSAADNMAAIAGHIEAVRASDRYGVGTVEQAFAGYKALPADTAANWRAVFGFPKEARPTLDQLDTAYKRAAREKHPDAGGSDIEMAHVNRARDYALAELQP
jgi:hypothetical protein